MASREKFSKREAQYNIPTGFAENPTSKIANWLTEKRLKIRSLSDLNELFSRPTKEIKDEESLVDNVQKAIQIAFSTFPILNSPPLFF